MIPIILMSSGGGGSTVGFSDVQSVLTSVTTQFSVSNIVAMIAGILGITVAFIFLWWGVRKAFSAIMKATTRGRGKV